MNYDYGMYEEPLPVSPSENSNSMSALRDLALQQKMAEKRVAELEDELQDAKDELRVIAEVKLPELMDELGIPSFQTSDGFKISIKETVRASMGRGDEEKMKAYDWLEKNGHGALIKRTVEVPFARGEESTAFSLREDLRGRGMRATFERRVESATLRAFVTEQLEKGADIPLDIFKVFRDRRAKVEL